MGSRQGEAQRQFQLGRGHLERREFPEALRCFLATLAVQKDHAGALNGFGVCVVESGGDLERAVRFFRDAVKADPDYVFARRNLAVALLQQNRVRDSVQEYRELFKRDPGQGKLRLESARLLAAQGWKEEGFQQLRTALARAEADENLVDDCLDALDLLGLPAAKVLAEQRRSSHSRRRRISWGTVVIAAGLGLLLAVAAVLILCRPAQSGGPEQLCREFAAGMPTRGLLERARQLEIFQLALFESDGRKVLHKSLSEIDSRDQVQVQERLELLSGRVVFATTPSTFLNRWCTVEFAQGRVSGAVAHSHVP